MKKGNSMIVTRRFWDTDFETHFERFHLGGIIRAVRPEGKGHKWSFKLELNGQIIGEGKFARIRHGEDWGRGLLKQRNRKLER